MTNHFASEYIFQSVGKNFLSWSLECIRSAEVHSGAFVNVHALTESGGKWCRVAQPERGLGYHFV